MRLAPAVNCGRGYGPGVSQGCLPEGDTLRYRTATSHPQPQEQSCFPSYTVAGLGRAGCTGSGSGRLDLLTEPVELAADMGQCLGETCPVGRLVESRARAGGVGERHDDCVVPDVALADALGERADAEDPAGGEQADGDDERRLQETELLVAPGGTKGLLGGRRRPVAAPRRGPSRIAARHRGAVERGVEDILLEAQPPAERLSRATAPRAPLRALDEPGCLPDQVRAAAGSTVYDRLRFQRVSGLDAAPTAGEIALQCGDGAVVGHGGS